MLPYFFVMVILAAYGATVISLVYNYFKNRKKVAGPPPEVSVVAAGSPCNCRFTTSAM